MLKMSVKFTLTFVTTPGFPTRYFTCGHKSTYLNIFSDTFYTPLSLSFKLESSPGWFEVITSPPSVEETTY